MLTVYSILLYLHIALGSVAMVLYWVPVMAKKGSALHIRAGKLFYHLMLIIAGSGLALSLLGLLDPISIYVAGKNLTDAQVQRMLQWRIPVSQFLFLLSLLTWVTVRHAIAVLHARSNRGLLRQLRYQGPVWLLFPTALYVLYQGIHMNMTLLIVFAIVSLITAFNISRYVYRAQVSERAWLIEHFSAMVGCGIAVYTAFFAFGGRKLLAQLLPGQWQLISWLAAPTIGLAVLLLLTGYYKRKYKVQSVQSAPLE